MPYTVIFHEVYDSEKMTIHIEKQYIITIPINSDSIITIPINSDSIIIEKEKHVCCNKFPA